MREYWIEENIRPLSHQDSDRLLIEDLEPIVNKLKEKGVVSWHFLRQDKQWRGHQEIKHIRLRFKANNLAHLKEIKKSLTDELATLKKDKKMVDYYIGNHGKPTLKIDEYYKGESEKFDEHIANPKGWGLVEKHFEIGSEMALLLIKGRMKRIQLTDDYNFYKISHIFPNQCRHYPYIQQGRIEDRICRLAIYDIDCPSDLDDNNTRE